MNEHAAQVIAKKRLESRAREYLDELNDAFQETLPGNHSPAETILLAYLMTSSDGYNFVDYRPHGWAARRKSGWGTTLGHLQHIGPILVPFILECRHDGYARQMAILVDDQKPGVRTAQKHSAEAALLSLGASVLLFTSDEIFADAQGCAERVEKALSDMTDAVLSDAGLIRGRDY
jgi:hypothetical protein